MTVYQIARKAKVSQIIISRSSQESGTFAWQRGQAVSSPRPQARKLREMTIRNADKTLMRLFF